MKRSIKDVNVGSGRTTPKQEVTKEPPVRVVTIDNGKNQELLDAVNNLTKVLESKNFNVTTPKPTVVQTPIDMKGIEEMGRKLDTLISISGKNKEVEFTVLRDPQGRMHKVIARPLE